MQVDCELILTRFRLAHSFKILKSYDIIFDMEPVKNNIFVHQSPHILRLSKSNVQLNHKS